MALIDILRTALFTDRTVAVNNRRRVRERLLGGVNALVFRS